MQHKILKADGEAKADFNISKIKIRLIVKWKKHEIRAALDNLLVKYGSKI